MPPDRVEVICGETVQRRMIPDYFTPEFADTLGAWSNIRRWGMPFAGGWADQPCRLMDVMSEYERLFNEWEAEEAKKHK